MRWVLVTIPSYSIQYLFILEPKHFLNSTLCTKVPNSTGLRSRIMFWHLFKILRSLHFSLCKLPFPISTSISYFWLATSGKSKSAHYSDVILLSYRAVVELDDCTALWPSGEAMPASHYGMLGPRDDHWCRWHSHAHILFLAKHYSLSLTGHWDINLCR